MTIPLDPRFIPAFSIEDVLLDKDTGAPLSGGLVYFEQDDQRGTLKSVFQITGTSPNYSFIELPNPMVLSSIGTFEDSLGNPVIPYFYPYDSTLEASPNVQLYYVRVTSSDDTPQFDREAVPYLGNNGSSELSSAFTNELSNPQFAEVLFPTGSTGYVYSFTNPSSQVVSLAPGWELVATGAGSGTVTVQQLTPLGSLNRVTNPGTILNIASSGLTSLILRQRLYGSPNLWGSGKISATFMGKTYAGTDTDVTMYYSQSNGLVTAQSIIEATFTDDGEYGVFNGNIELPASSSNNDFPTAYVDIYFVLPVGIKIDISSVMVVGTGDVTVENIIYTQTSLDRQIDQLYHYYNLPLQFKPIPSFLVGWDFGLNPAQLGASFPTTAINSIPTWDQTIQFSSLAGNLSVSRATTEGRGAYKIECATADTQGAIIQYIDAPTLYNILTNDLSINVEAFASVGLIATVSLWITANGSLPDLGADTSLVTTLDASGHPSAVVAGWVEVTRENYPNNAQMTIGISAGKEFNNYGFTSWNAANNTASSAIIETATFGAIVLGFAPITVGNSVTVNSVSLVPGLIATRPAPQTDDAVLRECERYFEKSYATSDLIGTDGTTPNISNQVIARQGVSVALTTATLLLQDFVIEWKTTKRTSPTVRLYSPTTGNLNDITYNIWLGGSDGTGDLTAIGTNWTALNVGTKRASYQPSGVGAPFYSNGVSQANPYTQILYHYVSDARLGLV